MALARLAPIDGSALVVTAVASDGESSGIATVHPRDAHRMLPSRGVLEQREVSRAAASSNAGSFALRTSPSGSFLLGFVHRRRKPWTGRRAAGLALQPTCRTMKPPDCGRGAGLAALARGYGPGMGLLKKVAILGIAKRALQSIRARRTQRLETRARRT